VPLSRSLDFHAVIHRRAEARRPLPFTACFTDARAFARLPGSPSGYELPFRARMRAARSLWDSGRGTASFRQLHLLRSCIPPTSPFATGSGFPSPVDRYSPGLLPL